MSGSGRREDAAAQERAEQEQAAPQISVVIPAFDAAVTLGRQLAALAAQVDAPPFEVVVADNRSRDATRGVALSAEPDLDLRVVPALRAQGANCARNEGIRAARAELLLCVDADDEIAPGALRAVADAFSAPSAPDLATGVPTGLDPVSFELPVSMDFLPYGISAFLALRREVFDAVGGFDEDFVGGQEEVDFCWRAQMQGFRLGVVRGARFTYEPRPDARSAFRQYRRYGATYIQLFVKHRAQGLRGSSLGAERHDVPRVARALVRLLRRPEDRPEIARGLGWIVGRWQGNLRHRVWGPR
ncbi:glycosyltransferase family 2 protein [Brachybacterium halotolerans subsp. kimchii]|uniref:glycosyltransferase n=1 Tax=Brachybacterium halotolerans TaxID=2795215 RepID=UPI001E3B36A4|nr:glycosyltransferase family A protein [Brachybacterium halotolerans]UEJ81127.1 glycosyltransferase family 2 protein [Brachybacterium halotolerans subsp. kimchii]